MTEESTGLFLRQEREKRGLSVEDVASQMRLSRNQIEALESGDYSVLPGPVFVRGFIRNYAKLLQVDARPLLEAVDLPEGSIEPPVDEGIPFPSGQKKSWVHYAIGFVLVAFSILFYEIYRENHAPLKTAPRPVKPAPKVVAPVVPAMKPESMPVAAPAPAIEAPQPVAVSMPAVVSMPAAVPLPTTVSTPAAAPQALSSGPIHLAFDADAWAEARDARGKIVFSKLNRAGTEAYVSGDAPFSLVIGNAKHVRLDYEGKPVALAPYIKVEVAHLTLK